MATDQVSRFIEGLFGGYRLGSQFARDAYAMDEAEDKRQERLGRQRLSEEGRELFGQSEMDTTPRAQPQAAIPTTSTPTETPAAPSRTVRQETDGFRQVNVPAEYQHLISEAENKYNLPPGMLAAQLWAESGFRRDAVGPMTRSGSRSTGIAQFQPDTAQRMGVDPMDPRSAIDGAARLMRQGLDRFNGNVPLALAYYNYGERGGSGRGTPITAIAERGDAELLPLETRNYINRILGRPDNTPISIYELGEPTGNPEAGFAGTGRTGPRAVTGAGGSVSMLPPEARAEAAPGQSQSALPEARAGLQPPGRPATSIRPVPEQVGLVRAAGEDAPDAMLDIVASVGSGAPTREAWRQHERNWVQHYMRFGTPQQAAAAAEMVRQTAHRGAVENAAAAYVALRRGDPRTAAALMARAYMFVPDGQRMDIGVSGNRLYAQTINEESGEITGAYEVTPERLGEYIQAISKPEDFVKYIREAEKGEADLEFTRARTDYYRTNTEALRTGQGRGGIAREDISDQEARAMRDDIEKRWDSVLGQLPDEAQERLATGLNRTRIERQAFDLMLSRHTRDPREALDVAVRLAVGDYRVVPGRGGQPGMIVNNNGEPIMAAPPQLAAIAEAMQRDADTKLRQKFEKDMQRIRIRGESEARRANMREEKVQRWRNRGAAAPGAIPAPME